MRLTATQLVTQYTCPFLRYVSYEVKQPLPVMGTRRKFGNVLHAALAAYESNGRSLDHAGDVLRGPHPGMPPEDLLEAGRIIYRRHQNRPPRGEGRPYLVEGSLRTQLGDHRLDVRVDRLDTVRGEYRLVEYKAGRRIDLEPVLIQLAVMSYVIARTLGKPPLKWEIEVLRSGEVLRPPAITDPNVLACATSTLAKGIEEGDREPRPFSEKFCRKCPARAYCPKASPAPKPFSREDRRRKTPQLLLF